MFHRDAVVGAMFYYVKNNQRDLMQNAKDTARQLIDQLPDSATLNDIMYELYVKQKIERGMQDSRKGKITPHEEVKKRYQQR